MKNYNFLEVSLTVLYHFRSLVVFDYFLVNFGAFQRSWKNQEIQDGRRSRMAQFVRQMTSPAHVADLKGKSFGLTVFPLSFIVIAVIF